MGSSSAVPSDHGPPGGINGLDPDMSAVELLTITEVAAALRVSKMTVYRFIRDGRLPAIRLGNSLRVHRRDLETYLAAAFLPALGTDGRPVGGSMPNPPGV